MVDLVEPDLSISGAAFGGLALAGFSLTYAKLLVAATPQDRLAQVNKREVVSLVQQRVRRYAELAVHDRLYWDWARHRRLRPSDLAPLD